MRTIICSCYTPQYAGYAEVLASSVARLGLVHHFYPYPGTGDYEGWVAWMVNCHNTANMTLRALIEHSDTPVLFVDSDATFERYPALLDELEHGPYDMAVYHMPDNGALANGTIWFRNSERVLALWCDYVELCRERLFGWLATKPCAHERPPVRVWEQTVLNEVLPELVERHGVRLYELPDAYCRIFDRTAQNAPVPVIVHWQGSRQFGCYVLPGVEDKRKAGAVREADVSSMETVLRSLTRPFLLAANADLSPVQDDVLREWPGTVVRFNNFRKGARCDLWITSCWTDVVWARDAGPTCTIYREDDRDYSGHIARWARGYRMVSRRHLHTARVDWRAHTGTFLEGHGGRRPTSGLMTAFALHTLGIDFATLGFSGHARGHSDETEALKALVDEADML
jgi:hypothetical protein